jgi:lipopolysaccharide export system protein LptC
MPEPRRAVFPLVVVALTTLVVWWGLGERPSEPTGEKPVAEPRAQYYLKDFTLQASDAAGAPSYRVSSPSAVYFRGEDVWNVTEPRWRFRTPSKARWVGRADEGHILEGGDRLDLAGDVHLRRPEGDGGPVDMVTPTLTVKPQEDFAHTADPVTITGPGYRIDGVGARVWLKQQRMVLLSKVKGRYDGQQRDPRGNAE